MKAITVFLPTALALLTVFCSSAFADIAVIVHPSNTNPLTTTQIKRIYLGQLKVYPDNSRATPVDQQQGSLIREMFGSAIIKKNGQQIRTYWAQLLFTGQGTPPQEASNDRDVKQTVAEDPTAIGYIDAANVDDTVKVIHRF